MLDTNEHYLLSTILKTLSKTKLAEKHQHNLTYGPNSLLQIVNK